jgi:excisionase family DNA binding protein
LIVMDFLTVEEVATELRLSEATIKRMLRSHVMPGYKLGQEWRIDKIEYEEWKRQRHNQYQRPAEEE